MVEHSFRKAEVQGSTPWVGLFHAHGDFLTESEVSMRGIKLTLLAVTIAVIFSLSFSFIGQKTRDEKRAATKAKLDQIGKAYAEYVKKYPTLRRGFARMQNQLLNKTFEETFANLSKRRISFDRMTWSRADLIGDYSFDSRALFRSLEIRKLLAEARAAPAERAAFLRKQMAEMAAKFPAARAKFRARKDTILLTDFNEMMPLQRYRYKGAAALYLLAEVKDFESLPMMASNLPAEGEPFDDSFSKAMVSPKWTIYSMHRLISQMPTEGLSGEARESRDAYLRLAGKKGLTEPVVRTVPSWQARYHSTPEDQPEDFNPADVPMIDMAVYPDRSSLTDSDLEALSSAMKAFVSLAFANETAEE